MSYSSSAREGRKNAHTTNTTRRMVKVARVERAQVSTVFRAGPALSNAWVVYGDCGHQLTRRVTESPILPASLSHGYPVGRNKRCPECPPPG